MCRRPPRHPTGTGRRCRRAACGDGAAACEAGCALWRASGGGAGRRRVLKRWHRLRTRTASFRARGWCRGASCRTGNRRGSGAGTPCTCAAAGRSVGRVSVFVVRARSRRGCGGCLSSWMNSELFGGTSATSDIRLVSPTTIGSSRQTLLSHLSAGRPGARWRRGRGRSGKGGGRAVGGPWAGRGRAGCVRGANQVAS